MTTRTRTTTRPATQAAAPINYRQPVELGTITLYEGEQTLQRMSIALIGGAIQLGTRQFYKRKSDGGLAPTIKGINTVIGEYAEDGVAKLNAVIADLTKMRDVLVSRTKEVNLYLDKQAAAYEEDRAAAEAEKAAAKAAKDAEKAAAKKAAADKKAADKAAAKAKADAKKAADKAAAEAEKAAAQRSRRTPKSQPKAGAYSAQPAGTVSLDDVLNVAPAPAAAPAAPRSGRVRTPAQAAATAAPAAPAPDVNAPRRRRAPSLHI